jgi:phospholipid/cholesterol/gamma-HCH transport system substrate-binding protein
MDRTYSINIKVGLFVLAGLIFSGVVIFLIGDERRLFESSVKFKVYFSDVQGLKGGAPIRMGGIDIGHVDSVSFVKGADSDRPQGKDIRVVLSVVRGEAPQVREDSRVKVATKGLLGDKMIEIDRGTSPKSAQIGSVLRGDEPEDMMGKANDMAAKADRALTHVEDITRSLADEELQRDLKQSVASLNKVMRDLSEGEGYPHKFITDKAEAERISRTFDSLNRTSTELNATLAEVRGVVGRVKTGPGFAHDVIYGSGPQKQIEQFGNAAQEIAVTLKGVREADSLVHDALYGGKGDGAQTMANIAALTGDLRAIVHDVRAGKGTVGALLVDPSVYEDMKAVLGNVERNDVLRALVRYSIKQDEKKPAVDVNKK